MANPSRMKREIDKAKKERAAEKRERRQRTADAEPGEASTTGADDKSVPNDEVIGQLERVHAQFAAQEIAFDEFERAKEALLAQLVTD